MTTPIGAYAESETVTHDLDPTNGDGDLVITESVKKLQSVIIAATSTDGNAWSASVRWVDGPTGANAYQSESNTDIGLSSVTEDWARLVRKGPYVEVTFTSEVADGTQNQINAYVDGHR